MSVAICNKRRRTNSAGEEAMDTDAVIADLQRQLAAALEERDHRSRQVENWQEYALTLHKEVMAHKATIEEQETTIQRLRKENRVHKELREQLSEQVAELKEEHKEQISTAPEQSEEEVFELQEDPSEMEEVCLHALALEDVNAELEICKRRLAQQEHEDMENIISVCLDCEELSLKVQREEHEEEKRELIVEIKARKMALEMLGDKLKEVAERDEYFKKKLEEINYDL